MSHQWRLLPTAVLVALVASAPVRSGVDPIYRAGQMLGRDLFWQPLSGLALDTTGMGAAEGVIAGQGPATDSTLKQAVASFGKEGKSVYRLDKPSAISLASVLAAGYPVLALTQWHCSLGDKVVVPKPGMDQNAMRHTMVSHYSWEVVEHKEIQSPPGITSDYRARLFFYDAGYCEYGGRDLVTGDGRQIMGVQGFTVEVKEAQYKEDMNVRRKVFAVYAIVPASKKPGDIQSEIEKAMDAMKLDMSYTAPEVKIVK
jgi:hypothetical protein